MLLSTRQADNMMYLFIHGQKEDGSEHVECVVYLLHSLGMIEELRQEHSTLVAVMSNHQRYLNELIIFTKWNNWIAKQSTW